MDGGISAGENLRGQWGHSERRTEVREEWLRAWPDLVRLTASALATGLGPDRAALEALGAYAALHELMNKNVEALTPPTGEQK